MENKEKISTYLARCNMETGRIEMADDFLLPEHLDDAKRIIRCDGTLRPGGRYVSGKEAEYEGEMVYSVLYITDTNSIKNSVFRTKYTKSFTVPEDAEQDYSVLPTVSGIECKLVNPRKMNLRCNIDLGFWCTRRQDCTPEFSGQNGSEDSVECERKYADAPFVRQVYAEKKEVRASRDFELPASDRTIKEIVGCHMTISESDSTVRSGGVDGKAEACFSCVYLVKNDENVEYACVEKTFRLENMIDCAELGEEYEGALDYYVKELSVSVAKDSDGENRVIELDFTYDICARFFANDECYPVTDLYSCDYECECERNELTTMQYCGSYENCTPFSATVDAPHMVWISAQGAQAEVRQVRFDENEKILYADADVTASAILRGEDGRFSAFSTSIPVRIRFEGACGGAGEYGSKIKIKNFELRLNDDTITASGELCVRVFCFEEHEMSVVSGAAIDRTRPRTDISGLPITFYYPEDGEKLWDIAKKYGSTEEIIRSANDITDDRKIGKSVLLIPCKRKKPLFSKVISK